MATAALSLERIADEHGHHMSDYFTDWSLREKKWTAADDLLLQPQEAVVSTNPDYAAFWAATARAAERGARDRAAVRHVDAVENEDQFEALHEAIQAQAEVIEAQDWQIEAMKEDHAELLAELDDQDRLLAKMQITLDHRDAQIERMRQAQQAATFAMEWQNLGV